MAANGAMVCAAAKTGAHYGIEGIGDRRRVQALEERCTSEVLEPVTTTTVSIENKGCLYEIMVV
ncbi:MAG TPA: hypothetical protein VL860_14055 [Planctomycetota bacterium]|nr:hypothetical protein [Planctomycetota bacterium]